MLIVSVLIEVERFFLIYDFLFLLFLELWKVEGGFGGGFGEIRSRKERGTCWGGVRIVFL